MQIGDHVRVLAPFAEAFPGIYSVDVVKDDGVTVSIYGDRDFDVQYLEVTKDDVTNESPIIEPREPSVEDRLGAIEKAITEKPVEAGKALLTKEELGDLAAAAAVVAEAADVAVVR